MNPFSIVCKSCAAKLKVAKASAVGQVLACPKCGTMLKVTPPQGWIAPPSESQVSMEDVPADSPDALGDTLGGMFDDIDDILADPKPKTRQNKKQKTSPQTKQQTKAKTKPDSTKHLQSNRPSRKNSRPDSGSPQPALNAKSPQKKTQRRKPATAPTPQSTSTAAQPLLPNDQWTSDATRKIKRLVTTIVVGAGSVILLGAIVAAVVMNLPNDKPADVKVADAANADVEQPNPDNHDLLADNVDGQVPNLNQDPAQPNQDFLENDDASDPPPLLNDSPLVSTPPSLTSDTFPGGINDDPAPSIDLTGNPPNVATDPVSTDSTLPVQQPTAQTSPGQIPQSPFGTAPPNTPFGNKRNSPSQIDVSPKSNMRSTQIGMVESFESDLGELSALLEEQGTSILDLKDLAASIRDRQLIGLAKYIVNQPEPSKLDMARQLTTPIAGVSFEDTPLSRVARTLNAITGVPITIDARSIVAANKDPNPTVSAIITSENLAVGLTQITLSLGLEIVNDADGILIGIFPSPESTESKLSIPKFCETNQVAKRRILETVKTLIEPKSWIRPNDPDKIELVGNEILVSCPESVRMKIASLLKKMDASHTFSQSPTHPEALAVTQSRWQAASTSLQTNPNMIHSIRKEISEFFNQFQTQTGITVLVDWSHVSSEGWTAQTILPGNIREATAGKTIAEIARSMNLTYRADTIKQRQSGW